MHHLQLARPEDFALLGGELGALGVDPKKYCGLSRLSQGAKFKADVLGIQWPMTIYEMSKSRAPLGYAAKPDVNQLTIAKRSVPGPLAATIQANLAYFISRTGEDNPQLLTKPRLLTIAAKARGGLYPGPANYDKYARYFGRDLGLTKYVIMGESRDTGGLKGYVRKRAVLGRLPYPCKSWSLPFTTGPRIVVVEDLGDKYGIGLYDPPSSGFIAGVINLTTSPVRWLVSSDLVNLLNKGVDIVMSILQKAFDLFCAAAQSDLVKLTQTYLTTLAQAQATIETQASANQSKTEASMSASGSTEGGTVAASGNADAVAVASGLVGGDVGLAGRVAAGDPTAYAQATQKIANRLCGSAPAVTPPKAEDEDAAIAPPWYRNPLVWLTVGGVAAIGVGSFAIATRRRRD